MCMVLGETLEHYGTVHQPFMVNLVEVPAVRENNCLWYGTRENTRNIKEQHIL
jgi:hypothetical protein